MTKHGCGHFMEELDRLIDRMRQEYEMTYAEVIGCLELMKLSVAGEKLSDAGESPEETEEDDE